MQSNQSVSCIWKDGVLSLQFQWKRHFLWWDFYEMRRFFECFLHYAYPLINHFFFFHFSFNKITSNSKNFSFYMHVAVHFVNILKMLMTFWLHLSHSQKNSFVQNSNGMKANSVRYFDFKFNDLEKLKCLKWLLFLFFLFLVRKIQIDNIAQACRVCHCAYACIDEMFTFCCCRCFHFVYLN